MHRSFFAATALLVACHAGDPAEDELAVSVQELGSDAITRTHVAGDVYHYQFVLPVGDGPNARLAIHRVVRERLPWIPRHTTAEVMLMHGDFASFTTNFAPMAAWLAERDVDVWGFDRRWTQAPAGATLDQLADFAEMGIDQQLDDIAVALAFARGVRTVTGGGPGRLTLSGFSRGGMLAYFYASREATRPPGLRHVDGILPIDVYASLAPEDEDLRQFNCVLAADEYFFFDLGFIEVSNELQSLTGQLALSDPDGQSPIAPLRTNRGWMLRFTGQTYVFFPATPLYHLAGPVLDGAAAVGLRFSTEAAIATWMADAPAFQPMIESADTDAMVCGDDPPADLPLSQIEVPVFLLAAAGGYGDHAIHSTTEVASTDVETLVIRQLPVEQEAEDYGHADLLFAADAPALAWEPMLDWLRDH